MPFLPISGRRKPRFEVAIIWAFMAFPRDEKTRSQYIARFHERFLAKLVGLMKTEPDLEGYRVSQMAGDFFGRFLEPLGGFSILEGAPGFSRMDEAFGASIWPGSIAGDLLITILQLRAAGLEASVNKAVAAELDFLSEAATRDGLRGEGRGNRYVRDSWERFKPACHLWAALRLWGYLGRPGEFSPLSDDTLETFLSVSQGVLKQALTIQPQGRREPLLDQEEMWQVSQRHDLPPVRLPLPPLEDWKLEAIRRKFKSLRP